MLKRRPLDGKFPGRGCAQKSAPVKGLADAALHRALLMMRGMCEGTEPMGKQPSSASAPGLWGPSGSPPFPSTMSLQGPTGSEQNSCGKENFDTVVESDETSPEISPVSPSDRIPLRVGKRKGSPDSPRDLEKLAPQGLLELSGGLSRGNDSAPAQVTHTSAGTPSAQGCSSIRLSCAQGQLHVRTVMIVIILSNLFSRTSVILGWDWCAHLLPTDRTDRVRLVTVTRYSPGRHEKQRACPYRGRGGRAGDVLWI